MLGTMPNLAPHPPTDSFPSRRQADEKAPAMSSPVLHGPSALPMDIQVHPGPVIPSEARNLLLMFFSQKQSPRRYALSKVAPSSFVFSGVIVRDFHAYWWAEGPCNTPRNDRALG